MDKVDKDAAWDESIEMAKNMKNIVDTGIALASTPDWDRCDYWLFGLEEVSKIYGMKPESEKKDF